MKEARAGFTLIELIITILMLVVLAGVSVLVLHAVLLSWHSQETRTGIDIALDRGIEEMVRDLRKARQIQSVNNDEIRFTHNLSDYYIYYLYNAADSYPSSFSQSSYQLRKATLSTGINGTFTYGSGQIIVTEVLPPAASDLSISANLTTLDLSVRRGDETIRSRTQVMSRNL